MSQTYSEYCTRCARLRLLLQFVVPTSSELCDSGLRFVFAWRVHLWYVPVAITVPTLASNTCCHVQVRLHRVFCTDDCTVDVATALCVFADQVAY